MKLPSFRGWYARKHGKPFPDRLYPSTSELHEYVTDLTEYVEDQLCVIAQRITDEYEARINSIASLRNDLTGGR